MTQQDDSASPLDIEVRGWKPIKTAPKDGTEIIVRDGVGGIHGAIWTTYQGRTDWFHHRNLGWLPSASWWMLMPDAPNAEGKPTPD